jgi:hypothetical protein
MEREKRPTKEPRITREPKKCKSHLFKDAYDQARKKKSQTKRT